jgi:RHS repeat-associated protein
MRSTRARARKGTAAILLLCLTPYSCAPPGGGTSGVDRAAASPGLPFLPEGTGSFPNAATPLLEDSPSTPFGLVTGEAAVGDKGQATYSYPLRFPLGRRGIEPKLTLAYSSESKNGSLGIGWELTGLSAIRRCTKTYATDGRVRPIRFDQEDRLCFDGMRLIEVTPTRDHGGVEFRLERDLGYRIVGRPSTEHRDDPAFDYLSFTIELGDGRTAQLGGTADAQELHRDGKVRGWRLNRWSDEFGNTMQVEYSNFSDPALDLQGRPKHDAEGQETTELLPWRISYAGMEKAAGAVSNEPPTRVVEFFYELHPTAAYGMARGSRVHSTRRLNRIEARVHGEVERSYQLSYEVSPTTGLSRLTSVAQCDGDGVCLPPTSFGYNHAPLGFAVSPWLNSGLEQAFVDQTIHSFVADFDGDGRDDFLNLEGCITWMLETPELHPVVYFSDSVGELASFQKEKFPGTCEESTAALQVYRVADLNGDGRADIFNVREDSWGVYYSMGRAGFTDRVVLWIEPTLPRRRTDSLAENNYLYQSIDSYHFPDFTGDGLKDIVSCHDGVLRVFSLEPSFRELVDPAPHGRSSFLCKSVPLQGNSPYFRAFGFITADFNGDMAEEVWGVDADDLYTRRVQTDEDGTHLVSTVGEPANVLDLLIRSAHDLNGDGLRDPITGPNDASCVSDPQTGYFCVGVNTGSHSLLALGGYNNAFPMGAVLADFNQDGRDDLYYPSATLLALMGDLDSSDALAASTNLPTNWPDFIPYTNEVGDFNGDGAPDVLEVGSDNGVPRPEVIFNLSARADLLAVVREGGDADSYRFTYSNLVDPGTHSNATCDPTPIDYQTGAPLDGHRSAFACVIGDSRPVVRSVSEDAGPGLQRIETTYWYRNGRRSLRGHGFLGFDEIVSVTPAKALTSTRRFDNLSFDAATHRLVRAGGAIQSFYTVELPDSAQVSVRHHLEQRSYQPVPDGTYRTTVSTNDAEYWAPLGTSDSDAIKTKPIWSTTVEPSDYDAHGYPRRKTTTHLGAEQEVEQIVYDHDLEAWAMGRRSQVLVTSDVGGRAQTQGAAFTFLPGRSAIETMTERLGEAQPGGVDPFERVVTFGYDVRGQVTSRVAQAADGTVRSTSFEHTPDGVNLAAVVNQLGHRTTIIVHPVLGLPVRTIDPNGEVRDVAYDGFGRPTATRDPRGVVTQRAFGAPTAGSGLLYRSEVRVGSLRPTTAYVDHLGRTVLETRYRDDDRIVSSAVRYDRLGRVAAVGEPSTDDEPEVTQGATVYTYDNLSRLTSVTEPHGAITRYFYDRGHPLVSAGRAADGRRVTIEDANGHRRIESDSPTGQIDLSIDALGSVVRYEYAPFNRPFRAIDPTGGVYENEFDPYGLLVARRDPTRGEITYLHHPFGEVREERDALNVQTYEVDGLGRVTRVADSTGGLETTHYDCPSSGLCSSTLHTTGRVVEQISRDGHRTTYEYDAAGSLSAETNHVDGRTLTFRRSYDENGMVAGLEYPVSADGSRFGVVRRYGANGALREVRDAASDYVYWQRERANARGQTVDEWYGNSATAHYDYEPSSGLSTGIAVTSQGNLELDERYAYDAVGNLTSRSDARQGRHEAFSYDVLDRLVGNCFGESIREASGRAAVHAPGIHFDPSPPLAPLGGGPTFTRPEPAQQGSAGAVSMSLALGADEQRVADAIGVPVEANGQLSSFEAFRTCTSYQYDPLGNMLQRDGVGTYDYPATAAGRNLPHAPYRIRAASGSITSLSFDALGRATRFGTQTNTYDAQSRLTSMKINNVAETRYEYAGSGGRVKKTGPTESILYHGVHFYERRTQSSGVRTSALAGTSNVSFYLVEADDRVVAQVAHHNDPLVMAGSGHNFGMFPWIAMAGQNAALRGDARISLGSRLVDGRSQVRFFHADRLGSPLLATDGLGTPLDRRSYSPFGRQRSPDWRQGTSPGNFGSHFVGFTSHEDEADSGFVNMQGRLYQPALGRFLTPDPVVADPSSLQSFHGYAYALNNPLRYVDPTGHHPEGGNAPESGDSSSTEEDGDDDYVSSDGPRWNPAFYASLKTHEARAYYTRITAFDRQFVELDRRLDPDNFARLLQAYQDAAVYLVERFTAVRFGGRAGFELLRLGMGFLEAESNDEFYDPDASGLLRSLLPGWGGVWNAKQSSGRLPTQMAPHLRKIRALSMTPGKDKQLQKRFTRREINQLARAFLGPNARVAARGDFGELHYVSADNKRLVRMPTPKTHQWAVTGMQANFHQRPNANDGWRDYEKASNVHLHYVRWLGARPPSVAELLRLADGALREVGRWGLRRRAVALRVLSPSDD